MIGFVYIWYDSKHKRFYIGSHKGSLDDGYISSSSWMKSSYKRRPHDFKRRILKRSYFQDRKDLLDEEQKWLNLIKDEELGKRYYNLKKNAFGGFTKEAWLASSKLTKGVPLSEEKRKKIANSLKKPWTEKRRKAQTGSYTRRLYYEYNGVIIGNVEQAIEYSGKSKATINRWSSRNQHGWRKYYVT